MLNVKTILTLCCEASPIICGCLTLHYLPKPYRILLVLSFITLAVDGVALYIRKVLEQSNSWLYNCYMIFDFGLLAATAYYFRPSKSTLNCITVASFFFLLSWGYTFFSTGISLFFVNVYMIISILILIVYIWLLYYQAMECKHSLIKSPGFWACTGIIVFYACNAPFFSIMNLLNDKAKQSTLHYLITTVLNNIRYLLLAYSFCLIRIQRN